MRYYDDEEELSTLEFALDSMAADELKKLAALTGERVPGRKSDIAALIVKHLAGDRLRLVWDCLDDLQRAAVAEAVHSPSARFNASLFRAKYGRDPNWGTEGKFGYDRKPSALCFFIYRKGIIPDDLKARLET